jgi:hypothetical protein
MDRARPYLKVAAFVPAIVLVGGFVGARAGVFVIPSFPIFSKDVPQPEAQPQPDPVAATQQPPAVQTLPDDHPIFMSGSKSFRPVIALPQGSSPQTVPPTAPNSAPGATPPAGPPVFLGGSKSAPIIPFPPPNPGAQQGAPPANPPIPPPP